MKVSVALGLGLALAVSPAFGQQPSTYHAKKSPQTQEHRPAKVSVPVAKTTDTSKELRRIEQQSAKSSGSVKATGPKSTAGSTAFKADKPRSTPPINAGTSGGMGTNTKGLNSTAQSKNPYKGRLRQKGSHN